MRDVFSRLHDLETDTRRLRSQLAVWRVVVVVTVSSTVLFPMLHAGAQAKVGQTLVAPVVIMSADGKQRVMAIEQDAQKQANLILFNNNLEAVAFRTTGATYKDAADPGQNYLNLFETWLYRYPTDSGGKVHPTPVKASSIALTRAGGSLELFLQPAGNNQVPAARLTAKGDNGGPHGALILYDQQGREWQPKQ